MHQNQVCAAPGQKRNRNILQNKFSRCQSVSAYLSCVVHHRARLTVSDVLTNSPIWLNVRVCTVCRIVPSLCSQVTAAERYLLGNSFGELIGANKSDREEEERERKRKKKTHYDGSTSTTPDSTRWQMRMCRCRWSRHAFQFRQYLILSRFL